MEQQILELSQDTKNFIKAVLLSSADPNAMGWFRAGALYMDAISLAILILQEDDPTLPQIVESVLSGHLFDAEMIAKNMLRWEMARPEMDAFARTNVVGKAANILLYCRSLLQERVRLTEPISIPNLSLWDFWLATMKIVFWVSPIITWMVVWRQIKKLFITRGAS